MNGSGFDGHVIFEFAFICLVKKRHVCIIDLFFTRAELTSVGRNAFLVIQCCSLLQLLVSHAGFNSFLSSYRFNNNNK